MFFRKSVHEKIGDIATKIRIKQDGFLEVPDLNCSIAQESLKFKDGKTVYLDFAEAQLLTRELSKNYGVKIRLPTVKEDYIASKLNNGCNGYTPEWKAEYLDGSFLMVNPEVRAVKHPRKYDFQSEFTIVEACRYSGFKNNGNLCWLGISKDQYDRAAFTSSINEKSYFVSAVPPLSKDCLNVRLLIDENKK
jgi:hypothetical protein